MTEIRGKFRKSSKPDPIANSSGTVCDPKEVAKAAGFLAADADYITGQELNVNGGCHM